MTISLYVLQILLVLLSVLSGMLIWQMNKSQSPFRLDDLLLKDGVASLSKVGQFVALCVSTWAFVYLVLANRLSEWFYALYMLTWAGAKIGDKALDVWKEKTTK